MGRVSPVLLAPTSRALTAWLCCCERPQPAALAPPRGLAANGRAGAWRSPAGTLCPRARGLSPQLERRSELLVRALRSRASPALQERGTYKKTAAPRCRDAHNNLCCRALAGALNKSADLACECQRA